MFRNTLPPRECFFASLRFHKTNEVHGAQAGEKTEARCVFGISARCYRAHGTFIGSNAIK